MNENKVKRKAQLKPAPTKRQEVNIPQEMLEKVEKAEKVKAQKEEPELTADQQAILFICQRGHQSFISILQGVNSTRVPIGKKPLNEETVRSLLKELEEQGYLSQVKIHDQPTWMVTPKARALET